MAKLIINPTSSSRREIPLTRSVLAVGRDPSNDLVLPDAMVSRRHAVLEYRGNQYFLRDCNSSNGSLVNGDRVSERGLRDGDLVAIGTARLLFRDDDGADEMGAKVVPHPSSPRMQCPACQADYRKGDAFCRQCGGTIGPAPSPKAICTQCGTVVSLPAKFCNACGHTLVRENEGLEITRPRPVPEALAGGGNPSLSATALPAIPLEAVSTPSAPPRIAEAARTSRMPAVDGPAPGGAAAASLHDTPMQPPAPPPPRPHLPRRPGPVAVPPPPPLPVPLEIAAEPAGFGPRLAAGLVDTVIVTLGQAVVMAPAIAYWATRGSAPGEVAFLPILLSLTLAALSGALGAVYYVYYWGVLGATPGKKLMGLAVQGSDGQEPIGLSQAFVRLLAYVLSGTLFGVGFLMIAFTGSGLHDRIADTRVVRRS